MLRSKQKASGGSREGVKRVLKALSDWALTRLMSLAFCLFFSPDPTSSLLLFLFFFLTVPSSCCTSLTRKKPTSCSIPAVQSGNRAACSGEKVEEHHDTAPCCGLISWAHVCVDQDCEHERFIEEEM